MSIVPQFGFVELMVLGVVALLVVGPKDLPRLMRGVGQAMAKVRRLADEFRSSFDAMVREAELEEMRKEIEELKAANPVEDVKGAVEEMRAAVTPASEMAPLDNKAEKSVD